METTLSSPNVEVDFSKLRSKKSLTINEGCSSSTFKPTSIASKDKGKGLERTDSEKKRMKEMEIYKLKQLNSFLRKRDKDSPWMSKG